MARVTGVRIFSFEGHKVKVTFGVAQFFRHNMSSLG